MLTFVLAIAGKLSLSNLCYRRCQLVKTCRFIISCRSEADCRSVIGMHMKKHIQTLSKACSGNIIDGTLNTLLPCLIDLSFK